QTQRFRELDYKKGEQIRDWYQRHGIFPGTLDPEIVPYYLLLIGPPTSIPFNFQYLLGIEYAVGRLSFETADQYERYAKSVVDNESSASIPNAKAIGYWGPEHLGDGVTELSLSLLIEPLAKGVPTATGALKRPLHADVGYGCLLRAGDDATKANLLDMLHAKKSPAGIFTAAHGISMFFRRALP